MYEPGKKIVIREADRERAVIIEDLVEDEEGNKLLIRELDTHARRKINPSDHIIVEQLED